MKNTKTIFGLLCLFLLLSGSSFGQQWFVKTWKFSQTGGTVPDYDPQGSYNSPNSDDVILYGTVNYSVGELDGTQGGAEVLINKNDVDGNAIWAMSLGTSGDEYVSRVVEDDAGNLVVAINQLSNGQYTGHLVKVKVTYSGGLYSFNVTRQRAFDKIKFKDLIVTYTPLTTNFRGYAFIGLDTDQDKAVVASLNKTFNHTSGNNWMKEVEGTQGEDLDLYSLIQATSTVEQPNSPPVVTYLNTLVVCGGIEASSFYGGRVAYLAKINLYTANIYDDFHAGYTLSDCHRGHYTYYYPRVFSEVIQIEGGGGYICMAQTVSSEVEGGGYEQYSAHIAKIDAGLDELEWTSKANAVVLDPNNKFCQLDLLETELYYTVVMTNPDNSTSPHYLAVNFLKDGTYNNHTVLADPLNSASGLSSSVEYYDIYNDKQQFIKDFALSCKDQIHLPAALMGPAPSGWTASQYTNKGVTHGKLSVGDLSAMCLSTNFTITAKKCDEIYIPEGYEMDNQLWAETTHDVNSYIPEFFAFEDHDASFYEHCASSCDEYTCGPTVITIYECVSSLGKVGAVLSIPNPTDVVDVQWGDGTTDNGAGGFIFTVFFPGTYDAKVRTVDGCVQYYEYVVLEYPETNLQATVTKLACHDDDNGDICFTADVSIVSAVIQYTYNNASYNNTTVAVGATSFCFSDLIASIHGPVPGLEAGYYEITVTDANGCTDTYSFTLQNPTQLLVTAYIDCGNPGVGDEFLEMDITGGAMPYFFSIYRSAGVGTLQSVPHDNWPDVWVNSAAELPIIASSNIDREYSPGVLWEYEVHVFDANGCQIDITGIYVPVCPTPFEAVGTGEQVDENGTLRVFPNPSSYFTTVSSEVACEYSLFSNTGQLVMNGQLQEGETQLNISQLPAGLYLLRANGREVNLVVE